MCFQIYPSLSRICLSKRIVMCQFIRARNLPDFRQIFHTSHRAGLVPCFKFRGIFLCSFQRCIRGSIRFLPLSVPLLLQTKSFNSVEAHNNFTIQNTYSFSSTVRSWISGLFQFVTLIVRFIVIWCIAFQLLILYPCSRINTRLKDFWWKIVLRAIEFSGPIFVKFGQWASTRRDIFSMEMCDYLSFLQHRRSPHSWNSTVDVLDRELGESWRNDFLFDGPQNPIGSGCVAQVYKMYLKPDRVIPHTGITLATGIPLCNLIRSDSNDLIPVALKVLHPNIHEHFQRDTAILNRMAASIQFVCPWLKWISLVECVSEFCKFMLTQIDLEKEAFYLERFSENFREDSYIHFPHPIYPYVTKNVLVESWEDGDHIGKFLNTKNIPLRKRLAEVLVECLLKMAFHDNLVHGDLHPGNILVQNWITEDSPSKAIVDDIGDTTILNFVSKCGNRSSPRLIILDCGLSTVLSPKDFSNFSAVFKAIVMGQGEEVGRLFLKHCINECEKPDSFIKSMADLVFKFRQNALSLEVVDVSKLFGSLFDILTKHKVKLESNFSSMMMAIIIVEGLGRSLDPEKDLMQDAKRYLLT